MSLFDYLGDILVKKRGDLYLDEYYPYLINRWLSFASPSIATILNETVNALGNIDKEQHYKFLLTLLPKVTRMPRINYIKKIKKDEKEIDKNILLLSQNFEISQREVKELLELKEQLT